MAAGGRVALRANAIVAATVVFVFGQAPDGLPTLRRLVLGVVSSAAGWEGLEIFAAVCVALATAGLPRIMLGLSGWMRSLPASRAMHRWAAVFAVCASQAFCLAFALFSILLTIFVYHARLSPAKLAAIPVIVVAAAIIAVFTARQQRRRAARARVKSWGFLRGTRFGFAQWIRYSWAALPRAAVVASAMLPAIFIVFAYLIVRHNPDIPMSTAARTVRICGSLATAGIVGALSNLLLRDRPTWPWSRSLPWSSTQRVVADAIAIGLPASVAVATLLPLDALQTLSVLATIPPIAVVSAGALRAGATRQTGAAGEAVLGAVLALTAIALVSWFSLFVLATTPWLLRRAARRDRRIVSVRFAELQHSAAGDAGWLGAE